jgi:hypothetical protein
VLMDCLWYYVMNQIKLKGKDNGSLNFFDKKWDYIL